MNQEEQDKIYQLIQTEDIDNWELAYQLIRGCFDITESNDIIENYLIKHINYQRPRMECNTRDYQELRSKTSKFLLVIYKQTKNTNN